MTKRYVVCGFGDNYFNSIEEAHKFVMSKIDEVASQLGSDYAKRSIMPITICDAETCEIIKEYK